MVEVEASSPEDAESDGKARDTRYDQATRRDKKITVKYERVLHKIPFQLLLKGSLATKFIAERTSLRQTLSRAEKRGNLQPQKLLGTPKLTLYGKTSYAHSRHRIYVMCSHSLPAPHRHGVFLTWCLTRLLMWCDKSAHSIVR